MYKYIDADRIGKYEWDMTDASPSFSTSLKRKRIKVSLDRRYGFWERLWTISPTRRIFYVTITDYSDFASLKQLVDFARKRFIRLIPELVQQEYIQFAGSMWREGESHFVSVSYKKNSNKNFYKVCAETIQDKKDRTHPLLEKEKRKKLNGLYKFFQKKSREYRNSVGE